MSDEDTRPEPPVPADVDLRDFPFMPLHVVRLRSSEQNSDVTPEANWAALQLWAASWHEVPAGSIPTNEQWQAKACGYVSLGTINPRWPEVRDGALRKFFEASDGRLYHPVVSEQVLIAWAGKLLQRWRSECGRIKKHNQRHDLKGAEAVPMPSYIAWEAAGRPTGQPLPVPEDKQGRPPSVPGDKGSKGQREGQGQGQGDPVLGAAKSPRATKKCPVSFEVTAEMVSWAAEHCPLVDAKRLETETAAFRDHTFTNAKTDWTATWRNWMRRVQAVSEERAAKAAPQVETAYQRSMRERTHEATRGLASARAPGVQPAQRLRTLLEEPTDDTLALPSGDR